MFKKFVFDLQRFTEIYNYDSNTLLSGTSGNDSIWNNGSNVTIDGGAGNDSIENWSNGSNSTLKGGAGNDYIYNYGNNNISIDGGSGNDSINNNWGSDSVTINGGMGDDYIFNVGSNLLFTYTEGDGNDLIQGFNETSTLQIGIGKGTYSAIRNGSDIIVTVGDGKITLQSAANLETVNIEGTGSYNPLLIVGTEDNDDINNTLDGATINALGGDDMIYNEAENVTIDDGEGNDYIFHNEGENVSINAGAGNDEISNYGSGVTINGGTGDDSISNNGGGSNVTIDGGADNDTIENYFNNNVSINGGKGNDYLYNGDLYNGGGSQVTINGGAGNDTIYNRESNSTIEGGAGNDSLYNEGENSIIDGGDDDDYIHNQYGDGTTINAGKGNDTILNGNEYWNEGDNLLFKYSSGDGNDLIQGFNETSTLSIGDGKGTYSAIRSGSDVIVTVGESKITLQSAASLSALNINGEEVQISLIVGTENADTINNTLDGATINALGGDDTISNESSNVSIDGGAGNDSIQNSWNGSQVTISGGAGNDSIDNDGSNVSIDGGDGNDSIDNLGATVSIDGGAGNDSIQNSWNGSQVTISGGAGNDSIDNDGSNVSIDGGDGNDSIDNLGATVSIDGGLGNDYILSREWDNTINGGAGDDTIYNYEGVATLTGGKGNDSIRVNDFRDSTRIEYNSGDGFDTIIGFNESSTLLISGGKYYKQKSGSDIIVTVGEGSITLEGAASLSTVNIVGEELVGGEIFNYDKNSLISGTAYSDSIYNYADKVTINAKALDDYIFNSGANVSIDGGAGYDSIENSGSKVTINGGSEDDTIYSEGSTVKIIAGAGNDYIWNNGASVTIDGGEGNNTISNGGYDGNGSWHEGGSNISINASAGNDYIYNSGASVTVDGGEGDDYINNDNGLVSINGGTGNDYISSSRGINVTIESGDGNDSIYNDGSNASIDAGDGDDYINNNSYGTIIGGKGNDTIENNDDNVIFLYSSGDGNDLIKAFKANNILVIAADNYSTQRSGRNVLVTVGNNKITLEGTASLSALQIGTKEELLNVRGTDDNDALDDSRIKALGGESGTINALGGDDTITNESSNVSINGSDGNDSIQNGGYWDWNYHEGGSNVSINGGAGDDSISNNGDSVTIDGGEGNDSIYNNGDSVIIDGGDGNDYLYNGDSYNGASNNVTIDGGLGNDSIENFGYSVTIDGGAGNDSIWNNGGSNVSIAGGAGDDSIDNDGDSVTIEAGDGNDSISNGGDYNGSWHDGGSNVSIDGGAGNDSIWNNGSNVSINGGAGNDTIENNGSNVTIDGGAGNDSIENYGSDVTINGGSGNDYIDNYVSNVTINGGSGNDYIDNYVSNVTINGGSGNDYIDNHVSNVTIDGGADDDSISNNYGNSVTISGGAGNDTITNIFYEWDGGENVLFKYADGDGNDLIQGFNETSTLSIGDGKGTYSATKNGSDLIVTVGKGKITLQGAADLSTVNISGTDKTEPVWSLSGTTATYSTWKGTLATVNGVKSVKGLSVNKKVVTVSNESLNQKAVTISKGYTLALADDVIAPVKTDAYWSKVSSGKATYNYDSTTAGYTLANNKITYTAAVADKSFTISGIKSTDGINVNGTTVTLSAANLNKSDVTISDGYTLKLASDVSSPVATKAGWSKVSSGKATYNFDSTTEGYTLADNQISYTAAIAAKSFTVSGIKSTSGININGTTVTLNAANLNKSDVTISDGYTLARADDVKAPVETKANWSAVSSGKATYNYDSMTAGYTLANNKISYTAPIAVKSFTISGIKSTDGININGTTVTLNAANLNKSDVSISDGYTLKLASDVKAPVATKATWSKVSSGKATYKFDSMTEGYTLADNKVTYTKAIAVKSFTVSGIKSTDGINVNGTTVTLSAANLNKTAVTISDGYTLKLASDVSSPVATKAGWSKVSSGNATYNFDSTTEGYTLANNKISYTKAIAAKSFTVSGIKSTDGINVNGTTVTLNAANLNKSDVSISDGYTLKLGNDVKALAKTEAIWSALSSGKATYKYESTTAGYTLADNKITYNAAITPKSFKISGIKSTDGIKVDGTTVILSAANLNKKTVTISDGYTLALADDVKAPVETKANWSKVSSGKATYKFDSMTEGYTLADNKITYTKAIAVKSFKVSGIKSTDGIKVSGSTVTLNAANLNKKTVTISDGYTLALDKTVDKPTAKKAAWTLKDSTATYKSAYQTEGYKLADNKISYSKATTPETLATVKGVKSTDGLKVSGSTIKLAGGSLASKVTVSGDYSFDFASDYNNATITGSNSSDVIIARGTKISVNGGKGEDTIKMLGTGSIAGGKGADVFYYKSNNTNVITDYAAEDRISLASGTAEVKTKGNDVIFNKKITVTGGASKTVTYIDAKGEHTYPTVRIDGKTITLMENYLDGKFNVADYGSALQTIDASAVVLDMNIIGNKLANQITGSSQDDTIDGGAGSDSVFGGKGSDILLGGKGDDTLEGGIGNDTLTGGAGADVFVYNKGDGNDTITDYAEEDSIKIIGDTVKKFTKKNDNVIFTLASKKKITVTGGADKIISYVDKNGEDTYPKIVKFNAKGTTATLTANYTKDEFNIADYEDYKDSIVTINASAVNQDISIIGNKKNNKILGGDGNDSIYGGAGNDSLTGGKGSDVFVYNKGDGNDVITDYEEEDSIKIFEDSVAKVSKKNDNVIFTLASKKKITVTGGADKVITYSDTNGEDTYPDILKFNNKGTEATLTADYVKDEFNIADYADYKDSVLTIDASAVKHDLKITGNKNANKIIGSGQDDYINGGAGADTIESSDGNDTLEGGKGNDSLWGGAGSDTLYGGDGADVFIYNNGDGKDVIADYNKLDTIMILSGSVDGYSVGKSDVTFKIGNGSLVVSKGASQYIELVDTSGRPLTHYSPK